MGGQVGRVFGVTVERGLFIVEELKRMGGVGKVGLGFDMGGWVGEATRSVNQGY